MNEKDIKVFETILNEIKELRIRKSKDYGNSWKTCGLRGIVNQIISKAMRIMNLTKKEIPTSNESLRDSFIDGAVYNIMAVHLIDIGHTDDIFDMSEKYDLPAIIEEQNNIRILKKINN
jgi:hypothetical protein